MPVAGGRLVNLGETAGLIDSAGALWTWGPEPGRPANAGYTSLTRPTKLAIPIRVKDVAAAGDWDLALGTDGSVWAWGHAPNFALNAVHRIPQRVRGLSGIVQVGGGDGFGIALRRDGTVWTWGSSAYGQLGRGTGGKSYDPVPRRVRGLTGVRAISANFDTALVLMHDRTLRGWGEDIEGTVDGAKRGDLFRPTVVPGVRNVARFWTNTAHQSGAITRTGRAYLWGAETGPRTSTAVRRIPLSGVTSLATSSEAFFALTSDGVAWSWGPGWGGALGTGGTKPRWRPAKVLANVRSIVPQDFGAFAVLRSGQVRAWGNNDEGQLGDGAMNKRPVLRPVAVRSLPPVNGVAVGGYGSAFATAGDALYGWGRDECFNLGDGAQQDEPSPIVIPTTGTPGTRVACNGR